MGLSNDHYKYAGDEPREHANLDDDVSLILEHCRDLGYDYYMYGGLVMQVQPSSYINGCARFFVSFRMTNDARQHFHEASGEGYVMNAERTPDALQHFLNAMKENLLPKPEPKPAYASARTAN